jgi:hypothetical protein
LRLATELFPAFVGVHGAEQISMIWAMLFYFSLLLLGIAQQVSLDCQSISRLIKALSSKAASVKSCNNTFFVR